RRTGHPRTSPTTSSPATEPARSPDADVQPGCATSTTPRRGPTAATQTVTTLRPYAPDTTTPNTAPTGRGRADPTGAASGSARPDPATWARCPTGERLRGGSVVPTLRSANGTLARTSDLRIHGAGPWISQTGHRYVAMPP